MLAVWQCVLSISIITNSSIRINKKKIHFLRNNFTSYNISHKYTENKKTKSKKNSHKITLTGKKSKSRIFFYLHHKNPTQTTTIAQWALKTILCVTRQSSKAVWYIIKRFLHLRTRRQLIETRDRTLHFAPRLVTSFELGIMGMTLALKKNSLTFVMSKWR